MGIEDQEKEYEMQVAQMVNFGNTWLYTSAVYQKENMTSLMEEKCTKMLMLLNPYLTAGESGAAQPLQ